jgi:hypothetical protein
MTAACWSKNQEHKQSFHILSKKYIFFLVKITFSIILSSVGYFSDIPSVRKRNMFNTYHES